MNTRGAGLGQGAGAEGGSREEGLPRELLRTVQALAGGRGYGRGGGRKEGGGQRGGRPETLQPGTRGRARRERASKQGARQGQAAGAERGAGRERCLANRSALCTRWPEGRGTDKAGQERGQHGTPQPRKPPAACGGTGRGGVTRRAATRQPAPKGAVCCVPAKCHATRVGRDKGRGHGQGE